MTKKSRVSKNAREENESKTRVKREKAEQKTGLERFVDGTARLFYGSLSERRAGSSNTHGFQKNTIVKKSVQCALLSKNTAVEKR